MRPSPWPSAGRGHGTLARTLATQTGMTNQWLKDQGLLSVKELGVNIHYPLGPVGSVNRLVRTRMLGGVGRGSSKLPLTRLAASSFEICTNRHKAKHYRLLYQHFGKGKWGLSVLSKSNGCGKTLVHDGLQIRSFRKKVNSAIGGSTLLCSKDHSNCWGGCVCMCGSVEFC